MQTMSPLDASFLHVEDDVSHMHIGSVGIFEGPAPSHAAVLAAVGAKARARPAVSPEGALPAVRARSPRLGRRPALHARIPHSPDRPPEPRRRRRAPHPRRARHVPAARPRQAAVGDVDRRGARSGPLGPALHGPPLDGRRRREHRPDDRAARRGARPGGAARRPVARRARAALGAAAGRRCRGRPLQRSARRHRRGAQSRPGGGPRGRPVPGDGQHARTAAPGARHVAQRPDRPAPPLVLGARATRRRQDHPERPRGHGQRRRAGRHHARPTRWNGSCWCASRCSTSSSPIRRSAARC